MSTAPIFDLIAVTGRAYQTVWAERRYLLRLAAIPFLFKILFFTLGYSQGGDENLLRMTLFMLPAWVVEGWMLAHVARLVLLGQRWPFRPTGERDVDLPVLQDRYRGVMGGAVTFALTQFIVGGWFALLMYIVPVDLAADPTQQSVSGAAAVTACVLLGVALYFFRYLWLYVPAAVRVPLRPAAVRLSVGMGISLRLLGLWFLCAVPAMVALQMIVGLLVTLAGNEAGGDVVIVLSVAAKAAFDIVKNLLCAVAVCHALRGILAVDRHA